MSDATRPSREQQIALMVGVEKRLEGHVRKWLERREVKKDLHRYDRKNQGLKSTYAR